MDIMLRQIVNREGKVLIIFKVDQSCNLAPYILFCSDKDVTKQNSNSRRISFFFPNQNVNMGDYVAIYISEGDSNSFKNKLGSTTWVYYWGTIDDSWTQNDKEVALVKMEEYKVY